MVPWRITRENKNPQKTHTKTQKPRKKKNCKMQKEKLESIKIKFHEESLKKNARVEQSQESPTAFSKAETTQPKLHEGCQSDKDPKGKSQ